MISAVGVVHEGLPPSEAGGGEVTARKLQSREHISQPELPAGEIRSQPQPYFDGLALSLELEEAHECATFIETRVVRALPAPLRIQQLRQVVGVARRVVEVVGWIVAPPGDLACLLVVHRPEDVSRHPADSRFFMRSRIPSGSGSRASSTTRPSERKTTRSAQAAARGSWVTMRIVCSKRTADSLRRSSTPAPVLESRFPVGSSARMMWGFRIRALAIATRCCSPPESSSGLCVRRLLRLTRSRSSSSLTEYLSALSPAMSAGRRTFSSAERVGMRLKNWNTKPIRSRLRSVSFRSESPESSVPPTITRPEEGLSRAPRMCSSVLFPDPEGPIIAVNSPLVSSSETSLSALTVVEPSPYTLLKPTVSTAILLPFSTRRVYPRLYPGR